MAALTATLDLAQMQLRAGDGRRLELGVSIAAPVLGTEAWEIVPDPVVVRLEISRMVGNGYALRLRFGAAVQGSCMRCLQPAAPVFEIDSREVDLPGSEDELDSPYVVDEMLDVAGWANDALLLELPSQLRCRPDCAGLCPECGIDLNVAGPEHQHDRPPDPRWAALRDLDLDP